MNKSNITWEQAFEECATHRREFETRMRITNELFPLQSGELRVNWVGLPQESRNEVYKALQGLIDIAKARYKLKKLVKL